MRAWILHENGDIRYEDTDIPEIKDDEVLVKVKAAGICGSDIPRIYRGGAYFYPFIPGHEFSGQVEKCGSSAENRWAGKRVGIFPLIPCGECGPCKKKLFEMCRKYSYLGSRRNGGFAEYAAVPEKNLIELPDNVSFEEAAMLEPMAVAVHSIRRTVISKDDMVTVYGLGTIGVFILMFLLEMGIKKILVIGNKDFQKKTVIDMGISEENFCDTRNTDPEKWLYGKTSGNGSDIFFECIGKNETINHAVNNTAPGGSIVFVGNPYSDISMDKPVYWKILRNQLRVTGTWNSSFTGDMDDDWNYVINKLFEKKIAPSKFISHRFDMESFEEGLIIMRDKSEDYLKIIMNA